MKMSGLAATVLFVAILGACGQPAAPVAPATTEAPRPSATETSPAASETAPPGSPTPARGKRAPCSTDQSCNGDPSVNALWGRCVKETGVCECNAGFELHPGGFCRPIAK